MNYYGYTVYPNGDILGKYGKILKHTINKEGYHRVTIYKNEKRRETLVHRLLGICYLSNPENKPTVHHIDENPNNNDLTNLMWATMQEQIEAKTKLMSTNTSGTTGVWYVKKNNTWKGYIMVKGKNHSRTCKTKELAIIARNELEELYLT